MPSVKYPETLDGGRFQVVKQLGEGCFGSVFLGQDSSGQQVAIKFETSDCSSPGSLQFEAKLLQKLAKPSQPQGFTEVFFFGKESSMYCMVMDLLGASLEQCLKACADKKMDDGSAVLVAQQALLRIEYLHSRGIVHRDIKPENFMYGVDNKVHHLYLIDFGLSEKYYQRSHVPMTKNNDMIGTARYASINVHKGFSQSRRDDLEAIGHMLLYFLRGSLPWSGLKGAKTDEEKYDMIGKKKAKVPLDELCADHHEVFKRLLEYARSLPYSERPDYERLAHNFQQARKELGVESDHQMQWLATLEPDGGANLTRVQPFKGRAQPDDEDGEDVYSDDMPSCHCMVPKCSIFKRLRPGSVENLAPVAKRESGGELHGRE